MASNQQVCNSSGSVSEYRKEYHDLLLSLKTTVEGLLALPCNNVWNTFGGLDRLAKSIESILQHRLKISQADGPTVFWHFIRGLRWLNPTVIPSIDRLNRNPSISKGQLWVRENLENHNLSSQLSILVANRQHLLQHYHAEAYLCQPDYFFAMLICLQAVEQNCPALLAEINPAMLYKQTSAKKSTHIRSNSLPFINFSTEISGATPQRFSRPDSSRNVLVENCLHDRELRLRGVKVNIDSDSPYSLYEVSSPCASSDMSEHESEHFIERINDPLMNYYTTSSTEKLKHSLLKLNHSVSSEMLDDSNSYNVPVTPSVPEKLESVSIALLGADTGPSFDDEPLRSKLDFSTRSQQHASVKKNVEPFTENVKQDTSLTETEENIQIRIRQKVLNRVKEFDSKPSNDVKPDHIFADCLADSGANVAEMTRPHNTDHLLDIILNRDDLDILSIKTDSGIESLTTQLSSSSQRTNTTFYKLQENLSKPAGIQKDAQLESKSKNKLITSHHLDNSFPFTKPSTVILSSSLPSEVHTKSEELVESSFFRPPQEGQSLMSFLLCQDFHTCTDLDREKAHFSIAEALIAAVEQMKWNQTIMPKGELEHDECDSDEEIQFLRQRIRTRRFERLKEKARQFPGCFDPDFGVDPQSGEASCSGSYPSYDSLSQEEYSSSSGEIQDLEINDADTSSNKGGLMMMKGLSLSLASLYSDADIKRPAMLPDSGSFSEQQTSISEGLTASGSHQTSADSIAISLLKRFSENQLPKASELVWLVSERDAPQQLLPLPDSYPVSPDDGENADLQQIHQQNRLRGNLDWAPPRPQIISSIHPKLRQNVVIARQNHRCAGCGSKVEKGYAKRYRYCEYLGKYFCQCCHTNDRAYIPGRILRKWDFNRYYVSHFASEFLKSIYEEPVFSVESKSTGLYQKVAALDEIRELRIQLFYLAPFINTCQQINKPSLDAFPLHWYANLNDIHYFSLAELVQVKKKELLPHIREIASQCITHVSQCLLCQGKGFICEICRNGDDIIYPFEIGRVTVCPGCRAAFHRTCFSTPTSDNCPKCARLWTRKQKLHDQSLNQDDTET